MSRRYPLTATRSPTAAGLSRGMGAVETGDWWLDATAEAEDEETSTQTDRYEEFGEGMTVVEDTSDSGAGAGLIPALVLALSGGDSASLTEDDTEGNDGPFHAGYAEGAADKAAGFSFDPTVPIPYMDEEVRWKAGYKAGYNEISLDDVGAEDDDAADPTKTTTGGGKSGGIVDGTKVTKADDPNAAAAAGGINPTIVKWGLGLLVAGGVVYGGYKLATSKRKRAAA